MVRIIAVLWLGAAGLLGACHASLETPPTANTLPTPRAGGDVLGARIPIERLAEGSAREGSAREGSTRNESPRAESPGDGSPGDEAARPDLAPATLLRWWTDTCPWCEASLPALEDLRLRFEGRGLETLAVYHPKPPRQVPLARVRELAAERGYHGPLARDLDWGVLREFWLGTGERRATSASFLIDGTGEIRFVHPGPVFFPSDDPQHAREDADFEDLARAIEALLEEAGR